MKKIIKLILLILFVAGCAIAYTIHKYNNNEDNSLDYTNSIFVVTKHAEHGANDYYEVNSDGKMRITSNFNADKSEKYEFNECFQSYADEEVGKILNKYTPDTCKVTDGNYNELTLDSTLKDMVNTITYRLYNQIKEVTIYKSNDHYYASIKFSLQTHDSYKFYYYDTATKKLKHICTFNDKYVIGVKEKDKFIFEEAEK